MSSAHDVESILDECLEVLLENTYGLPVSPEAYGFWRERYRTRFLAALTGDRPRVWDNDRERVLAKVRRLGAIAGRMARDEGASAISKAHARLASASNDCPATRTDGTRVTWCEPSPIPPEPEPGLRQPVARFAW